MADPQIYLEKISGFSRLLQLEGLSVSPQETADACRVLIELGVEDREQVKTALRTVYAKSREEQISFDRVFDGFFLSVEALKELAKKRKEQQEELEQQRQQAREELEGQPLDLSQEQQDTYAAMPEKEKQRLRNFMEKYRENASRNPGLYDNFIHSVFTRAILDLAETCVFGKQSHGPIHCDPITLHE